MAYLPYWMKDLTPEMVELAEKELGETPESKELALKEIKQLINDEPNFYPRTDDAFLLRFLRCRKFNVQKAFKTLKNFYTFKARYSGILTDFKPSDMQHLIEMNHIIAIPKRDYLGAGVGLIDAASFDFNVVTPDEIFACILVCTEIGLEPAATQVCGYRLILDTKNFGMKIMKLASPTLIYRIVQVVQDCIPCRIKGFHFVNDGFLLNALYAIAKPLMSEKLASRVHFHGDDMKSLHKYIPPETLPAEFGGTAEPLNYKEYNARILGREEHFININKFGFHDNVAVKIKRKKSDTMHT